MDELIKRITELETNDADRQHFIDQLSDMVAEQWQTIDALKREVNRLRKRIEGIEARNDKPGGEDMPPPHY